MSSSDVPLVVLTTCMSEDKTANTAIDLDLDADLDIVDINGIHDANDVIFAAATGLLSGGGNTSNSVSGCNNDSAKTLPDPEVNNIPTDCGDVPARRHLRNHGHIINADPSRIRKWQQNHRRSASVRSDIGPPSYHSIFSSPEKERHSKTRLSLPSARDAFRRLSDAIRHGSPSVTSVYPESPTSVTTLTGFIIRDKNADGETQTRQVFRLAAVLVLCGTAIAILETVTSLHAAAMITGFPYAGIGAGVFIALTGALGIFASTRKDCPYKYYSFYKGLSLISLLMGVVVLCSTLANLDVRWLSHPAQMASVGEVALYIAKVVLAAVDITTALASIYI